jgi:3D (Asp-Asp-Asp) domain-containing protein
MKTFACSALITLILPLSAVWAEHPCVTVDISAYTSDPSETNENPHLTASGEKVKSGDKVVAVSRDLEAAGFTFGKYITIENLPGQYEVADRTHERWEKRVDLYMGNDKDRALEWGVKTRKVCIAKE